MVTVDDADGFPTLAGVSASPSRKPPSPRLPRLVWRLTRFSTRTRRGRGGRFPVPGAVRGGGVHRRGDVPNVARGVFHPDRESDAFPAPSLGVHAVHPENDRFRRPRVPKMTPSSRVFPATSDDEDDEDEYDDEDSFGASAIFQPRGFRFHPHANGGHPGEIRRPRVPRVGSAGDAVSTEAPRRYPTRWRKTRMATSMQAVGRVPARVEYRARMDAARRTESAARRTEEVARRTEAAVRLEAENADVVGEPTFRNMIVGTGTEEENADEDEGPAEKTEGEDSSAANDDGPNVAVEPAPAPEEEPPNGTGAAATAGRGAPFAGWNRGGAGPAEPEPGVAGTTPPAPDEQPPSEPEPETDDEEPGEDGREREFPTARERRGAKG